jgi:serine dehydrogenase proteinase
MPTWGEQLRELGELKATAAARPPKPGDPSPHDQLRRRYLRKLSDHTGRATIFYGTCWLENKQLPSGEALSLNLGDQQGFMEAVSNISERELDLILTSPGGSPEAAEAIMGYLRTRFDHIRAVVPIAAMSAATMMSLACDEILMGTHSQLGPIDPQFTLMTPEGPRSAPGQAILDQFEMAKAECQDPRNIGAWLPLLRSLLPGLIAQCIHSREQAEHFVAAQLEGHMLQGDQKKAKEVAAWFADFSRFKSHGRPVTLEDVQNQGLNVTKLEDDQTLQDLVLSVHHAVRHTFNDTGTTKLIENHHGRAYLEMTGQMLVQQGPPTASGPGRTMPEGNRQQRRQNERSGKKKGRQ